MTKHIGKACLNGSRTSDLAPNWRFSNLVTFAPTLCGDSEPKELFSARLKEGSLHLIHSPTYLSMTALETLRACHCSFSTK